MPPAPLPVPPPHYGTHGAATAAAAARARAQKCLGTRPPPRPKVAQCTNDGGEYARVMMRVAYTAAGPGELLQMGEAAVRAARRAGVVLVRVAPHTPLWAAAMGATAGRVAGAGAGADGDVYRGRRVKPPPGGRPALLRAHRAAPPGAPLPGALRAGEGRELVLLDGACVARCAAAERAPGACRARWTRTACCCTTAPVRSARLPRAPRPAPRGGRVRTLRRAQRRASTLS